MMSVSWCLIPLPGNVQLLKLGIEIVAVQHAVDHLRRPFPIIGTIGMTLGDEAGAGIEHLVLQMARGEFGADGVPGEAIEFYLVAGAGGRRLLSLFDEARNF